MYQPDMNYLMWHKKPTYLKRDYTYLKIDNIPNLKSDNTITPIVIWRETNLKRDNTITPIVNDGRREKTPTKKPGHHPSGRVPAGGGKYNDVIFLYLFNVE